MENEIALLQDIKSAIWILIYLIGISVSITLIRALVNFFSIIKSHYKDKFNTIAQALFESGDFDALIDYCNKTLIKKPKEAYAHWFLGKVYFQKEDYDTSLKHFTNAIELSPNWEKEYIQPYLEKIHNAKSTANNALNQTGANNAPPG